jgi:iron complex outermembrane receptor protein
MKKSFISFIPNKQFILYISYKPFLLALAGQLILPAPARSETLEKPQKALPEVVVLAPAEGGRWHQNGSADTAAMLLETPGYSVASNGGVAGLPIINGLGDDRLKIRVDGMEITSACANHMNAPLSYIDPSQVGRIDVVAGVTPVSAGGDSIAGTITVTSAAPTFAAPGQGTITRVRLSASGRTVNDGVNAGVGASVATDRLSLGYTAAYARAHSYDDGDGKLVLGSMVESINQAAVLALRGDGQLLTMRAGIQHIPYQGFPNQYMDMTDNHGRFANATYAGTFGWGELDSRAYWQHTAHEMGFFTPERPGTMPMVTSGRNRGYALKASLPWFGAGRLRFGHEWHGFTLDDYWPAVPGSMMMGPQTYVNINQGRRDRAVLFAEAETVHDARWTTLLGARRERVHTDAGAVQPYADNMMNAADAAAAMRFNASIRDRRDSNLDLTALARFTPDAHTRYELALARKTRSPNLYERYSWGRGTMAMTMTNWFGDGNGYVGNLDLRPETATTVGVTLDWHGAGSDDWFVKLNPYYTRVRDYIDVDVLGSFNPYMQMGARGTLLQFANHDARLYGANLAWRLPLAVAESGRWGTLHFTGNAALTRGQRVRNGGGEEGGELYRIMPLNTVLALEQSQGKWTRQLEAKLVAAKHRTDARRLEPQTAGYALLNLRTSYQLGKNTRVSAGISNLLDKQYADPQGGIYLSGLLRNGGSLQALPGYGRSLDLGFTTEF